LIGNFARRSKQTKLDDQILEGIRGPVTFTLLITGVFQSIQALEPSESVLFGMEGVLYSSVVLVWMSAVRKTAVHSLRDLSTGPGSKRFFKPRTLPLTTLLVQVVVYVCAIYFLFRSWGIDATAWLASAGIFGVALGFAAQSTLGDLLAGVSLMMDPPFEVGDFVELDTGHMGRVRDIGLINTRVWSLDDVELVLPNSMMTSRAVTNASRGPRRSERLRFQLTLRYGENVDVQLELLRAACEVEGVLEEPAPKVRLVKLGDFGLEYELLVWIAESEDREPVQDRVNRSVIKELGAKGMDVPFPRYEVSVSQEEPARSE